MLSGITTLDDLELENQRVFVRANLDAPVSKTGAIEDDAAVLRLLRTIEVLEKRGARIIIASRFGSSKSEEPAARNEKAPSIEPIAARLAELGRVEVHLPDGGTSEAVRKVVEGLKAGRVCVLENLAREDEVGPQDETFARALLPLVDVFVADSLRPLAYGSVTTTLLPRLLEKKVAGPNLMGELSAFARLRSSIDTPRLLIWGGNSLRARQDELLTLLPSFHQVALVGVAANTMLAALGADLGASTVEQDFLAGARTLADKLGDKLILPEDLAVGKDTRSAVAETSRARHVPSGMMALDLGPRARQTLAQAIADAGAVVLCGTAGFFRNPAFAAGTHQLVDALDASSAFTVVVGDDSVGAVRAIRAGSPISIDCLSDGGKSALALLQGKKLPGLEALRGTQT